MTKATTLELRFGALSDPLYIQVKKQGFPARKKDFEGYQKMANALAMVRIHGLVSETEASKGERRLLKKIIKERFK